MVRIVSCKKVRAHNQEYVDGLKGKLNHEDQEGHEVELDDLSNRVIGCAIEVHRALGPGLLESTYEQCLSIGLALSNTQFQVQAPLAVEYEGVRLDCGYRVDPI